MLSRVLYGDAKAYVNSCEPYDLLQGAIFTSGFCITVAVIRELPPDVTKPRFPHRADLSSGARPHAQANGWLRNESVYTINCCPASVSHHHGISISDIWQVRTLAGCKCGLVPP